MIEKTFTITPREGLGPASGPVKLRAFAGEDPAGTPFRVPGPPGAGAPETPARAFRPAAAGGNGLPAGEMAEGNRQGLRNLFPTDAADPASVSTRQMLEQAGLRLAGEAGGALAEGISLSPTAGGDAAAPAMAGPAVGEPLPIGLPADLLPDLELEFPAAPLEPPAAGLALPTPPLDGSATTIDGAPGAAGLMPGVPGGVAPGVTADALTGMPPGARVPAWSGALPPAAGANPAPAAGLPTIDAAGAAQADESGNSTAATRAAESSAGMAGRSLPLLNVPLSAAGAGMAPGAQALAAHAAAGNADVLAGLRQAMADLARDGGASDRRPPPDTAIRSDAAGFLSTLGLTTAAQGPGAERPVFMLPSPPGTPEFADQVAERVVWMAGQKLDRAQIRLNPAHLGPISVDVSVGEDGANITFTAQHAMTRDALEQALPRLREMFNGSGLSLAGADVAGHGPDARRGGQDGPSAGSGDALTATVAGVGAEGEAVAETPVRSSSGGRGIIDTYV